MKITESFTIDTAKENVWSVFMEVEKLAGCVPGCKQMKALSDTQYEADMEVKTKFMTIAFKATGELKDFTEGEEMNIEMVGKPMKLAGLFKTKLKVKLNSVHETQTMVTYDMDLQMSGRLASLGDVLMKGTVLKSSKEFADNVKELFKG